MPAALRNRQTGQSYALDPTHSFVIGRSQVAQLRITNGEVAPRHTFLEARPAANGVTWWVWDGGSTNGTRLNGRWLDFEPVALQPGDEIELPGDVVFVFDADIATPSPARTPSLPLEAPAEVIRQVALELLEPVVIRGDYRASPLGHEVRAAVRRAAEGPIDRTLAEALAAVQALDGLDRGDVVGAFRSLLSELDREHPPSPRYVRLTQYLVAVSPDEAGTVLCRRVCERLEAGGDAVPYASLLGASAHEPSLHEVLHRAAALRDRGHVVAREVLRELARTDPSPWWNLLCEHRYPAPLDAPSAAPEGCDTLPARVAQAVRAGTRAADASLLAEVVQQLRATPVSDVDKRATLRAMLQSLTGQRPPVGGRF